MKSAVLKELNYQFKTNISMKTKTSILALIKAFFILIVSCCFLSCSKQESFNKQQIERKYFVQIDDKTLITKTYLCDTIIWIDKYHFSLKNNEQEEAFEEVIISPNVNIYITLRQVAHRHHKTLVK